MLSLCKEGSRNMAFRKVHMIEIKELLIRLARGESKRSISRSLKTHRSTINKYLKISISLGYNPFSDSSDKINEDLIEKIKNTSLSNARVGQIVQRNLILLPYKDEIEKYIDDGLKGSKIIQILKRKGVKFEDTSFYRFVNSNCENYWKKNITIRLPETEPGKYGQIDFGRLGKIWDKNISKNRNVYALIVTMCCSRHMYVHITFRTDMMAVINGCEEAFRYFEGIPLLIIFDNLKPVIVKGDTYEPRLNKSFFEYSQFRGFTIDPAPTNSPKGKPIVERAVPYVRDNFFKGENFISIDDCQERAVYWCTYVAGKRIHNTTRKIPYDIYMNIEKSTLLPFKDERYDIPYWSICKVHPDHHIRFKNSLYSVPTKYISKNVEVRGDSAIVKIYHEGTLIKIHKTVQPGSRSTDFSDYPETLTPYALRNPNYQIGEGYKRGEKIGSYIESILKGPYPWHRLRTAQKILRLADKYGSDRLTNALNKAEEYCITDIRRIDNMLRNNTESIKYYDLSLNGNTSNNKDKEPLFLRDAASFNHYK